jgi:hypothetical protein
MTTPTKNPQTEEQKRKMPPAVMLPTFIHVCSDEVKKGSSVSRLGRGGRRGRGTSLHNARPLTTIPSSETGGRGKKPRTGGEKTEKRPLPSLRYIR